MGYRRRLMTVAWASVMVFTACGPTVSPTTEADLPDSESWADENPQPSDGTPLDLAIDFIIGPGFEGETVEVRLDGELVVEGSGNPDPDEHHCGFGPYRLIIESGTHEIEATTGSGESLVESFDLTTESSGHVFYRHPSADSELGQPELSWQLYEGPWSCA